MAIIQLSKIQHKRGDMSPDRTGLPVLAPGELGYATNQRRLFVGNTGTSLASQNTEVLTQTSLGPSLTYDPTNGKIDAVGGGSGATYNIDAEIPTAPLQGVNLTLNGSTGLGTTKDSVRLNPSGGITITRTDANTITIGGGGQAAGPNRSVQLNNSGAFTGSSSLSFSTNSILNIGSTSSTGFLSLDGANATISTSGDTSTIRVSPGPTGSLLVGPSGASSLITSVAGQALTVRGENTLNLTATSGNIFVNLTGNTSKIRIQGVSASVYATGLSDNDLVNKQYVDSKVSSGTTATVSSVGLSGGASGLTIINSPITSSGTMTITGTLAVRAGGTGLSSTPVNGAIDIGNGTGFTRTTLTAGPGITITNGTGSITISSTATGGGSGTIVGPSTSTLRAIATYGNVSGTILLDNPSAVIDSSGNIGATSFNATSSIRVKTEVESLGTHYLSNFDYLQPKQYYRTDINRYEFGFIAEEMIELYPEIVARDALGKPSGIDYGKLSTILTAKVHQQQSEIADLQQQIRSILEMINASKH